MPSARSSVSCCTTSAKSTARIVCSAGSPRRRWATRTARIREVLYPLVGEDVLINLLREYKASGHRYTKKVHTVVRTSYGGHYRRMLPADPERPELFAEQRPLPADPRGVGLGSAAAR